MHGLPFILKVYAEALFASPRALFSAWPSPAVGAGSRPQSDRGEEEVRTGAFAGEPRSCLFRLRLSARLVSIKRPHPFVPVEGEVDWGGMRIRGTRAWLFFRRRKWLPVPTGHSTEPPPPLVRLCELLLRLPLAGLSPGNPDGRAS